MKINSKLSQNIRNYKTKQNKFTKLNLLEYYAKLWSSYSQADIDTAISVGSEDVPWATWVT